MNLKATLLPMVVGMSLAGGAAIGLLYLLYKKDDEIDFPSQRQNGAVTSTRATTIKVNIPKEVVGIVIGRGGANIREIQDETKTHINFLDENMSETYRVCVISGVAERAQYAESLIHNVIRNQPLITTFEMSVPQRACGRIIGRCGENIRVITQSSGAKVTVDSSSSSPGSKYVDRRIILKGTAEQIAVAKSMIDSCVDEDSTLRKKCEAGAQVRTQRGNKSPMFLTAGGSKQVDAAAHHDERLTALSSDGMMEVYVSAVENPGRFWVQVVSPNAVELDQLLEHMTEYYSKEENRELHDIKDLSTGQYVAAPFQSDSKWYRAQVVSVTEDDYAPEESQVELYYVDYGDSFDAPRASVLELRADFLKLTFQAIECTLAKVKPRGGEWSEESSDLFEELTYNARWKVMMCSVDHYDSERVRRQDRGRREGSPVPVVSLFDISGSKDVNVADELVKNQFAVYVTPKASVPIAKLSSPAVPTTTTNTVSAPKKSAGDVSDAGLLDLSATPVEKPARSRPLVAANFGHRRVDDGGGDASRMGSNGYRADGDSKPSP